MHTYSLLPLFVIFISNKFFIRIQFYDLKPTKSPIITVNVLIADEKTFESRECAQTAFRTHLKSSNFSVPTCGFIGRHGLTLEQRDTFVDLGHCVNE